MSHIHFEGGPTCRFATKKRCDENMTQFNHGHLGHPCIKQLQESKSKRGRMNSTPTCTIVNLPEHGQAFADALATQLAQVPQAWSDELAAYQATRED